MAVKQVPVFQAKWSTPGSSCEVSQQGLSYPLGSVMHTAQGGAATWVVSCQILSASHVPSIMLGTAQHRRGRMQRFLS